RKNLDVAALHAHRRAERFETLEMQINWPVTDDATAGQSHGRLLATAKRGSEHAHRSPHFAHDVVRRDRMNLFGRDAHGPAAAFDLCAEIIKNLQNLRGIAQIRHAMNDTGFWCERRCGRDWQQRILRAADLDGTRKRIPAVDEDLIHTWQKE